MLDKLDIKIDVNKILIAVLVVAIAFFAYTKIKRAVRTKEREKVLQEFPNSLEAQLAARLYTALTGFTEDEQEVMTVGRQIEGAQMFNNIRQIYKDLYNSDLVADLQKGLDSSELKEFLDIVNGNYFPPQDWARRFYKALHGSVWGEDEDEINQLGREICPYDFARIGRSFESMYKMDLASELQRLLSASELQEFLSYVNQRGKTCKNY